MLNKTKKLKELYKQKSDVEKKYNSLLHWMSYQQVSVKNSALITYANLLQKEISKIDRLIFNTTQQALIEFGYDFKNVLFEMAFSDIDKYTNGEVVECQKNQNNI